MIVLKRTAIIDWNWSSVVSVSFIIIIFSTVGIIAMIAVLIYKSARLILKMSKPIEGNG